MVSFGGGGVDARRGGSSWSPGICAFLGSLGPHLRLQRFLFVQRNELSPLTRKAMFSFFAFFFLN